MLSAKIESGGENETTRLALDPARPMEWNACCFDVIVVQHVVYSTYLKVFVCKYISTPVPRGISPTTEVAASRARVRLASCSAPTLLTSPSVGTAFTFIATFRWGGLSSRRMSAGWNTIESDAVRSLLSCCQTPSTQTKFGPKYE